MGDLIASSTTDSLEKVRAAVDLPPQPTAEEQAEAEEMEVQRRENGHLRDPEESPRYQRRMDKLFAQKSAAERRAEAAEYERNELRQQLEQMQSTQQNGHMDRALAAEARLAELEQRLATYEQYSTNGNMNALPAMPEEQPPEEIPTEPASSPPEQAPPPQPQAPPPLTEEQSRQQAHQKRFLDMVNNRPDADQLIERFVKIPVSPELEKTLSKAMLNTPNSAELAMHLLENADVMEKIARLSPDEARFELARISGKLEGMNGQSRPAVISRAPAPISPLSGHPVRQPTSLSDPDISQAEFRRIRDQQERDWRRGVRR